MSRFELVIFDCDGVVVDSEMLSCGCMADTLTRNGLPTDTGEVIERFLGRSFVAVKTHYEAALGRPLPQGFRHDFLSALEAAFQAALEPMPDIVTVLDRLDCPYCLASSSDAERLRMTLSAAKLESCFDGRTFDSGMVERAKPAPDLFLHAARTMGAEAGRTLVIEDSENGVRAGKAAGMTVWGFTGGSHNRDPDAGARLTAAGADRVFASMAGFDPA